MRRRKKVFIGLAVLLVGFVATANTIVASGGGGGDASSIAATATQTPQHFDCALVLGAGVDADKQPSQVLEDRLEQALTLYRNGSVERLIVSGDHRTHAYDEPNAMRIWLEARGVPSSSIFMDHAGTDTYSSVWRARHVFGAERIAIVTQRFHLRRAVWLARDLGMHAEGFAADRRLYRGAAWFEVREVISRTKAFVDARRARVPHHAGPKIPLDSDGRITSG